MSSQLLRGELRDRHRRCRNRGGSSQFILHAKKNTDVDAFEAEASRRLLERVHEGVVAAVPGGARPGRLAPVGELDAGRGLAVRG